MKLITDKMFHTSNTQQIHQQFITHLFTITSITNEYQQILVGYIKINRQLGRLMQCHPAQQRKSVTVAFMPKLATDDIKNDVQQPTVQVESK